jgi:hypothetical protein
VCAVMNDMESMRERRARGGDGESDYRCTSAGAGEGTRNLCPRLGARPLQHVRCCHTLARPAASATVRVSIGRLQIAWLGGNPATICYAST